MKTKDKIKMIKRMHSDIEYASSEFEGKLFGSNPDCDVKFHQMVEFAKENGWLLEMIIKIAKELDQLKRRFRPP